VPPPHDPDSFIRTHGGDAFRKIVEAAVGYFDFLLDRACAENDPTTDRGRLTVVSTMADALAKARNQVLTDTYVRKTALRLGVSPEAVQAEMRKAQRAKRPRPERADEGLQTDQPETEGSRPDTHELQLLRLLLRHEDQVEWFSHHLDPAWLDHHLTRELAAARLSLHDEPLAALLTHLPHEAARALASELLTEDQQVPEPVQQAEHVVTRLRNRHLDRAISRLMAGAAASDVNEADQLDWLREIEFLRRLKRQKLTPLPDA
jgi:DNA primase